MSALTTVKTVLSDLSMIKRALIKMGWKEEQIELHETAQQMQGYHRDGAKAQLIIRKKHLGTYAYNDLGFFRQADGTVQALVGDYSESRGGSPGQHGHMKGKWMQELVQNYALCKIEDELSAQGFFIDSVTKVDGKLHVNAENPYL